jgi:hypothetical protein
MRDTDHNARKDDHLTEEDWVDFARQQGDPQERARQLRHLETGCRRCAKTVRLWKAVSSVAHEERSYDPPAEALRQVRGRFALHKPPSLAERIARQAVLLFDSFAQPAPAGVRAAGPTPRQLLYQTGPYTLKLRVEPEPGSDRLSIVGQILDEKDPRAALQDIGVLALQGSRMLDRTLTNRLGEFQLEPDAAKNLYLSVGIPVIGPFAVQLGAAGGRKKARGR